MEALAQQLSDGCMQYVSPGWVCSVPGSLPSSLSTIEVRVWNDPRFSGDRSAAEFSKLEVVKALLSAEQAAGLNVAADTAREGRASGGGGGGSIEAITAQLMNDRFIAAASLVTGCDTIAELIE
eukprot:COSAG02_NODE_26716_length_626_cov_1.172676_1_plen_123_part_10